jgi:hypothetical protein
MKEYEKTENKTEEIVKLKSTRKLISNLKTTDYRSNNKRERKATRKAERLRDRRRVIDKFAVDDEAVRDNERMEFEKD